ncbi:MAG: hypothetical protein Q8O88_02935 [bacterium]|nr:hypothetical protein [bacterium]
MGSNTNSRASALNEQYIIECILAKSDCTVVMKNGKRYTFVRDKYNINERGTIEGIIRGSSKDVKGIKFIREIREVERWNKKTKK